MQDNKFILVTGGAGYIGSHTIVELIKEGYNPVIVDDFRNASDVVLIGLEKLIDQKLPLHRIDICDKVKFSEVFKKYSFAGIIHFAALKAVGESVEEPLMYYHNNLIGLINVLELAIENNVNNLVFSSSCTVYGEPGEQRVVIEDSNLNFTPSPYGSTKQMGERILSDVVKANKDLKVLSLRYFNPIGAHPSGLIGELPFGSPNNLLPYITQTAAGKRDHLTVFGNDYNTPDGTCIRDYIHVCDLANAHVKGLEWLEKESKGGYEVVNVGTGMGSSVLEIIHTFEEVSGLKINWKFGERRAGDVPEIYADTKKAFDLLGWKPEKSLTDAVTDAWNWEKNIEHV